MPDIQEPVTVWAVTEGEYSDYRYRAIFESEEEARAAKARGLGDGVVAIPFYPIGLVPQRVEQWFASARIDKHPAFPEIRVDDPWVRPIHFWPGIDDDRVLVRRAKVEVQEFPNGNGWFVQVTSPSQKGALKACADRLAKLKAEVLLDPQPEETPEPQ